MKLSEENKNIESDITPYLNKIIYGDSLEVMRKMPSESIDLMVTSPPYNLKKSAMTK